MQTWNDGLQDVGDAVAAVTQGACLSTDAKPSIAANGSMLVEMDTSKMFFFDLENKIWREFA